jgi:hypothetical protein
MENQYNGDRLITTLEELFQHIRARFFIAGDQEVYISGSNMGNLLGEVLSEMDPAFEMKRFCIMVPSLSASGMIFRTRASRKGAAVRVTTNATHDWIVGNGVVLIVSVQSKNFQKPSLLAAELLNHNLYAQAWSHMQDIWRNGHPIDL